MPAPFILGFTILGLLAGSAIAYVIGAAAILTFIAAGRDTFMAVLPQRLFSQLDSFAFLAMPLFIFAGDLMNRGGLATALIDFTMSFLGRLKGGLGHVNVATSVFFAGVSGSAVSDAAALGNSLVPEMRRRGYSLEYAAAITGASSIIGPIIPPSSILIFYGALMETNITALFAAGIVPGLLIAALLMAMNTYYAHRDDHPGGRDAEVPAFFPSLLKALPAMSLPVIILGGTLFGFMTPAEAAAMAVVAALVIGVAYRQLSFRDIGLSLQRTCVMLGALFIILCAISTFSYLAALLQWPQAIMAVIESWGLGPLQYLMLINVIFLIAGMVMDVKAAVALFAPIFVPVALAMGIDPVHLGIVICFNITIGLLSPPLGGVLLILATTVKMDYWKLVGATFPFFIAEVALLIVLTFFPDLTLALPRLLGLAN
ncbi:TRAP transporter large permease [Chachezhania antarctica]|uniref:TRAP transporter large permease n=1 Tax=Chachezhania antarctica TaxID=2340860 RepID=UPI000EB2AB53|nr:TRAP transporter large permease [Chachezhania antarctica]|tara:strand:+ start:15687 stop:16973 length:1287 start_codon:yes stop_codon:yes gene_type:complete